MTQREKIEELITYLKSELNDYHTRYYKREIPDVMTFTELQDNAVNGAIAQIETLITEGKIEELYSLITPIYGDKNWGEEDKYILNLKGMDILAVIETLQASLKGNSDGK